MKYRRGKHKEYKDKITVLREKLKKIFEQKRFLEFTSIRKRQYLKKKRKTKIKRRKFSINRRKTRKKLLKEMRSFDSPEFPRRNMMYQTPFKSRIEEKSKKKINNEGIGGLKPKYSEATLKFIRELGRISNPLLKLSERSEE